MASLQAESRPQFYALNGMEESWNDAQRARWDRVWSYAMHTAIAGYLGEEPSGDEIELSMDGLGDAIGIAQGIIDFHRTRPLPGEDHTGYLAYLAERGAQNSGVK